MSPLRRRARLFRSPRLPVFVKDSFSYSGGMLFTQLSSLVTNVLLRRILPPATMGLYDFVTVVQSFALTFDPGISAAASIDLPARKGAGDEEQATRVRSTAFLAELGQGFVMAAGIIAYVLLGGAQGDMATSALVAAVIIVLYCMQDSLIVIHQGNQSFAALSGALLLSSALGMVLLPGGAAVGGIDGLFAGVIALFATRVALLVRAARRVGIAIRRHFDRASFRALIGFGLPLRLVEAPTAIIGVLDLAIVTRYLGLEALALYSFARLVFLQAANLPAFVGNVFVTRVFRLTGAQVSRAALARDSKEFLLLEYLVVIPLLVCTTLQAFGLLTTIVLPEYADSTDVLAYLVFAIFFVPQTSVIRNFWMVDGRLVSLGISNLVGLLSHAAGIGLLVWSDGLSVSSVATGSLIGWAGYYLWLMATIGRELWGKRGATDVGLHALTGAGISALVVWLVPIPSGDEGALGVLADTAVNVLLSFGLLAPLVAYGVWRTQVWRHFRHRVPPLQAAEDTLP